MPQPSSKPALSFPLLLVDHVSIETARDAADLFANLSEEQKEKHHWKIAIKMLSIALQEPTYLKAATMSLQTALAMDGKLLGPLNPGTN